MTKPARDANQRWPGFLLAALVAVLVTLFGAGTASAATATAAQTRVGAHTLVAHVLVGPHSGIGAGQRLGNDLPAYDFALATGVAAETGVSAADDVAVIGRQWDTAIAKDWPGHDVLNLPKWSIAKNDAWVDRIIQKSQRVYVGSPETKANLWDVVNNRSTVFGRELQQLFEAGYTRSGDYLIPRG